MIDAVLSFLQVYFQAFLSNHSLFCFRLLFPISSLLIFQILGILRFPLKNGVKYRLKILITEAADFFIFSLFRIHALVVANLMANSRLRARKTKPAFVSWGPSRGRWSSMTEADVEKCRRNGQECPEKGSGDYSTRCGENPLRGSLYPYPFTVNPLSFLHKELWYKLEKLEYKKLEFHLVNKPPHISTHEFLQCRY